MDPAVLETALERSPLVDDGRPGAGLERLERRPVTEASYDDTGLGVVVVHDLRSGSEVRRPRAPAPHVRERERVDLDWSGRPSSQEWSAWT